MTLDILVAAAGEAQPSGWAAFEEPQAQAAQAAAPPAVPPAPHNQTAAVPQEQPKAEAFSGWQAFDSQPAQPQQASPASAAAAAGAGSQAGVMKELPSVSDPSFRLTHPLESLSLPHALSGAAHDL